MGKSKTETCCLTLPLKLEKWQEDRLAKRFEIARQIYNTLVHAELKKLNQIERSSEYQTIQDQITNLDRNDPERIKELPSLYKKRTKLLRDAGFTEYGFKSDVKYYYKYFHKNIGSSVAVHGIAPQVWAAFEKSYSKNRERSYTIKERGPSVLSKEGPPQEKAAVPKLFSAVHTFNGKT